ncbi:Cation/H(+) antiporter 4 [Glycine soja]
MRASPGAAVKLCLGDLLVMGSNPETTSYARTISGPTYGVMMINIMVIASIVKWSVKLIYDPSRKYAGYPKRNIASLKPDSELRVVACLHKTHHASAVKDCLDLCCPTTEDPNYDIILAFDLYEHDNMGAVTAHVYTAISPPSLMHEDVCHLALDKVASIIILPFHLRWSGDGAIESDYKNARALNCKLLEIAPCSVGILVGRSAIHCDSFIQVAMIFLGGNDDREALCLAKRVTRNPRVNLVVYHLVPKEQTPDVEYIQDKEALKHVMKPHLGNVSYQKVMVNGGPETFLLRQNSK